jgi:hypothetical protein
MVSSPGELPVEHIEAELKRLRQGEGLAHPSNVLKLSPQLRRLLVGAPNGADAAGDVVRIVAALGRAIDHLAPHERLYAQVDFNLIVEHSYQTLTDRQESLARQLACAAKTVRRRADRALQTVALLLAAGETDLPVVGMPDRATKDTAASGWRDVLRRFWRLTPQCGVDIVCSEIPEDERPYFASPDDRNYLRYAKFADLDSLIFVKTDHHTGEQITRDHAPA